MKKPIKIAVIGGGSSYTPELMEGLIQHFHQMPIQEIWLVDIEEGQEKMQIVFELAQRMWKASGIHVPIIPTVNRRKALKDADFVLTQLRVGGLEARIMDERVALSYGMIGQETNGAAGIFKAFRTIPLMLEIVEEMKELCPNAWLINFTNPSGMITEAIIRYGHFHKIIGLCNLPYQAVLDEAKLLEKKPEDLVFRFAGLNHFHWHKVYDDKGNDVTLQILKKAKQQKLSTPANITQIDFQQELLESMNLIPCSYHTYYYNYDDMLKKQLQEFNMGNTRAQQVKKIEQKLFELYQDKHLDHQPEQLKQRGGAHYSTVACNILLAIYENKQSEMVVSTQNKGAISFLDPECVVEISSLIGANGASPICFDEFSYSAKGMLTLMKEFELCVCKAAVLGDYGLALEAFVMNPLIPSGQIAKNVLDELLVAHKKHLPQFQQVIETIEPAIEIKDDLVKKMLKQQDLLKE